MYEGLTGLAKIASNPELDKMIRTVKQRPGERPGEYSSMWKGMGVGAATGAGLLGLAGLIRGAAAHTDPLATGLGGALTGAILGAPLGALGGVATKQNQNELIHAAINRPGDIRNGDIRRPMHPFWSLFLQGGPYGYHVQNQTRRIYDYVRRNKR